MNISVRLAAVTCAVLGAAGLLMPAVGAGNKTGPCAKSIDALFSSLIGPQEPGAAVLVVEGGRVVFERGYGVTDLRTRRPIDGRTNFRLASVTKQFTAAAVMLLVRDGRPATTTPSGHLSRFS